MEQLEAPLLHVPVAAVNNFVGLIENKSPNF